MVLILTVKSKLKRHRNLHTLARSWFLMKIWQWSNHSSNLLFAWSAMKFCQKILLRCPVAKVSCAKNVLMSCQEMGNHPVLIADKNGRQISLTKMSKECWMIFYLNVPFAKKISGTKTNWVILKNAKDRTTSAQKRVATTVRACAQRKMSWDTSKKSARWSNKSAFTVI